MSAGLQRRIDPWTLARQGGQLQGEIGLEGMARLLELLAGWEGCCHLALSGSLDDEGQAHLTGRLHAVVGMVCQRCLEQLPVAIDTALDFTLVADEATAAALTSRAETLVTEPGALLDLWALVEDELILGLPLVARHADQSNCAPQERCFGSVLAASPFAALHELVANESSDNSKE
jgi:uncharacterized protein